MAAARVRVLQVEEKEGEEEQVVEGGLFILQEGGQARGERGEGTGARRPWRQCFPWRHSERGKMTGGSPLSGIYLFPFFRIFSRVLYLIEAFKHFQKFCKKFMWAPLNI